jgi:hypothetical protein
VEQTINIADRGPSLIKMAERGTCLSNGLWLRECRKLAKNDHQTAILATEYKSEIAPIAASMFSRWSQENFFKYMRQHFSLDLLIDHQTESIDATTKVVNPTYRETEGKIKKQAAVLSRQTANFGSISLKGEIDTKNVEAFESEKAKLLEAIAESKSDLAVLKTKRKETKKHIAFSELPEDKKFRQLSTHSKHLLDTIKMIAYRAEATLVNLARESMARSDDAHTLVRSIYAQTVDILPDIEKNELHVRVHNAANQASDKTVEAICKELTATETIFPGTDLKLVYSLVSQKNI